MWQYFTYFFRDRSYWLYLNARNRPRYGDPLLIPQEWKGLPARVDGMTQIMKEHQNGCPNHPQKTQFEVITLFFKGASDKLIYCKHAMMRICSHT